MTYVIAWKNCETVFLIADSAATTKDGRALPTYANSTFGELHVVENGRTVQESAFKIFRWPHLAISCAGDVSSIRKFVSLVDQRIAKRFAPWAAFSLASKQVSAEGGGVFEAVAAAQFFGKPRLFRLDMKGVWHVVDKDDAVHLGSPARHIKQVVNAAIVESRSMGSDTAQLACVLAMCQSLTVHHGLLEQGAGGAFSGLTFNRGRTCWQPDIAYLIVNPDDAMPGIVPENVGRNGLHVSCVIRDDILFVSSPTRKGAIAFASTKQAPNLNEYTEKVTRAFQDARQARDNARYDYVSLISMKWPATAVVHMAGESDTRFLKLNRVSQTDNEKALVIVMAREITHVLGGQMPDPQTSHVFFFPFKERAINPHPSSAPQ